MDTVLLLTVHVWSQNQITPVFEFLFYLFHVPLEKLTRLKQNNKNKKKKEEEREEDQCW
jgi:hypothetical protein